MPFDDKSLAMVMTVEPNTKPVEDALIDLGKAAERTRVDLKPSKSMSQYLAALVGGQGEGGRLGQIGGMLGGAVGGAPGAVLGGAVAEKIPSLLAKPVDAVNGLLGKVGSSLNTLGGSLGPVALGFDAAGGAIKGLGSAVSLIPGVGQALGPMISGLSMLPDLLKGITDTLVGFAAKASPAQFQMWAMALEDVQGVIGGTFLPVLELMRDGVRLFGDALASILPTAGEAREAMAPLRESLQELFGTIREYVGEMGPVLRHGLLVAIRLVSTGLGYMVQGLRMFYQWLQPFWTWLRDVLGLRGEEGLRSSVGAAARQAHMGGAEEYQRQLQLSAYTQPGAATAATMPATMMNIQRSIDRIADWLANPFVALLGAMPPELAGAITDALEMTRGAAAAARGAARAEARTREIRAARSTYEDWGWDEDMIQATLWAEYGGGAG